MIPTDCFIWNSAGATAAGSYDLELYFNERDNEVRVGDVLTCSTSGEKYKVKSWTNYQTVLYSSGTTMTVLPLGQDIPPTNDTGFDSSMKSEQIPDYLPDVAWGCSIGSSSETVPAYTFTVTLSSKRSGDLHPGSGEAQPNDYLVDHLGNTFKILTYTSWDQPFKVYSVNERQDPPYSGSGNNAVIYRPKHGAPITHQGILTLLDSQRAPDTARNLDTVIDWIHRGLLVRDHTTTGLLGTTGLPTNNVTELITCTGLQLEYRGETGWRGGRKVYISVQPGVGEIQSGEADGSPLDSGIKTMLLGKSTIPRVYNDVSNRTSYWFVDEAPKNLSGTNLSVAGTSFVQARESVDNSSSTYYETAAGTQNSYTSMDGTLTLTTDSEAFCKADTGLVQVSLNGVVIAKADLGANFKEANRESNQDISGYDTQGTGDPMTNGVVNFTGSAAGKGNLTILSVGWSSGIGASIYQKGQVRVNITSGTLWRKGYNYLTITHDGHSTNAFKIFHDKDSLRPGVTGPQLTSKTPSYKYLSGVKYYGSGSTFNSGAFIVRAFDNVYHISNAPVILGGFPGVSPAAIAYNNSASFGITSLPFIGAGMGVTGYNLPVGSNLEEDDTRIYFQPRDPYGSTTALYSDSNNISIMSYGNDSTNKMEYFHDERYRFPSNNNFNSVPTAVVGNWDSSQTLTATALQVYNEDAASNRNQLYWPQVDYSTNRDPVGPNYSSYSSGQNKEYIRAFVASFDASNGILQVPGITDADLTSNVTILIKVPTKTMWLSLNSDYDMGTFTSKAKYSTGTDGTGCRIDKNSYSPDKNHKLRFTLGSYAADSSVNRTLFVRIIYKNSSLPRYLHGSSGGFGIVDW